MTYVGPDGAVVWRHIPGLCSPVSILRSYTVLFYDQPKSSYHLNHLSGPTLLRHQTGQKGISRSRLDPELLGGAVENKAGTFVGLQFWSLDLEVDRSCLSLGKRSRKGYDGSSGNPWRRAVTSHLDAGRAFPRHPLALEIQAGSNDTGFPLILSLARDFS